MPPKRDPVPRARSAGHWLGGFLLLGFLAAGVIAAGVKLWQDLDIQRLTRSAALREPHVIPQSLPPVLPSAASHQFPVALLTSDRVRRFFPDSQYYPHLLDRWEQLIAATGGLVRRISSAAEIAALEGRGLLVAPSPVCLDESEVEAIRSHADEGGGLVLSWAAGARDSSCQWVGWEHVARLTGTPEVRDLGHRDAVYFTVPSGTPLSVGFDPGTRVELRYESQLTALTGGPRVYWSDWALNSAPAEDAEGMNAAAVTAWTDAGGRVVWLGFRLDQGATSQDDERIIRLAANGVRWAAEVPVVVVAPWPGGARAALLLTQDVESQFGNSAALAQIARRKNVPVTFFVVSRMALDHPSIAESLTAVGEVGSQTSDHSLVAGLPYGDQHQKLTRSWDEVRHWSGEPAFGLHPPEERFDENTLRAWRDAGGSYLVAVNESRTAAPEVFETPSGSVVLLPRIIKDDYNVFVQESALRSLHLAEAYLEGMRKVHAIGGLAIVSSRSQVGGDPGRVRVLGEIVDSARAMGNWWIATGHEIAEWWQARRRTVVSIEYSMNGELRVHVVAPPEGPLREAWLSINIPSFPEDWRPFAGGRPLPYVVTDWGIATPLSELPAGADVLIVLRRNQEGDQTV